MATVFGPLSLWATWLGWFGLLTGVGLLARRVLLRMTRIDADAVFASFWIGYGAVTTFLILQHFFVPIGTASLLIVAGAGLFGLLWNVRHLLNWLRVVGRWRVYQMLGLFALFGWWSALHGVQAVAAFDTHLYLAPAVEWFTAYRLPPGLANLNERFGFNTGTLPFAAMLEHGPWVDAASYLLNGIFVTAVMFRILTSLAEWPKAGPGRRVGCAFDALLLAPLLALVASPVLFRSLEADLPAALAILSALSLMVARIGQPTTVRFDLFVGAAFAATLGAIIKLSAVAVALPLWLFALFWLIRSPGTESVRRPATVIVAGSSLLALSWAVRGVVLSGYPFYPLDVFGVPVSWQVPAEQIDASRAWVSAFARGFYNPFAINAVDESFVCGAAPWLHTWLRNVLTSSYWWQVPLPLALTVGFAAVGVWIPPARHALLRALPLFLALLLAAVTWFVVAPRPDLGLPIAWSMAGLAFGCVAIIAGGRLPRTRGMAWQVPAFLTLCLAAAPIAGFAASVWKNTTVNRPRRTMRRVFPPLPKETWLVPTQWEWPLSVYVTPSGLRLFLAERHRCSRAPLPCTSHPADNLQLRRPGDLSSGFVVTNGQWHAERFPNPASNFLSVWREARRKGVCG